MVGVRRETEHLQVVIDGSAGSKRAVTYVGRILGRRRRFHVHLLHLLPPLPPELLEFGGTEDPRKEQKLEAGLRREQRSWISSAREAVKPTVDDAVKALRVAGISSREIGFEFSYPTEPRDAAQVVLDQALAKHCHTIVIGHEAHSWFREIVGGHLTEHVLRRAHGISIWIVQ